MKQIQGCRFLLPVCGIVIFLLLPAQCGAGVRSGMKLCAGALIPSLFPVSVIAGCLLRMKPERAAERLSGRWMKNLFGLSGRCAVPFSLGLLGGFPLGAQLTATMYREGSLSRTDAIRLSMICNNAGPAFLLGAVGGILGGQLYGVILFLIQLLSATLCGMLLRSDALSLHNRCESQQPASSFWDALPSAISESVTGMLRLTGSVVFFSAVTACVSSILPLHFLPQAWTSVFSGVLEVSAGIELLRGIILQAAFPVAAFLVGWGGFCVHLQAAGALHAVGLPVKPYLVGKLLHALISALLAFVFLPMFTKNTPILFWLSLISTGVLIFYAFLKKYHWKTVTPVL